MRYVCNGAPGVGTNALVLVTAAGSDVCPAGGQRVTTGSDADGNGQLTGSEIASAVDVCDGEAGADAVSALASVSDEEPGLECAAGGKKLETGIDTNGNGSLDPGEVVTISYVCNGTIGTNSLVNISNELPGESCALGGQKIEVGRDSNDDSTLDPLEIEQTRFVCNGGGVLLRAASEEPGLNCAHGGVRIETGTDLDSNDVLDVGEVTRTEYVCNQNRAELFIPLTGEQLAAGGNGTCAVEAGEVWCWGYAGAGQLLDATAPVGFVGKTSLPEPQVVDLGSNHGCAIISGAVWCWGNNVFGQLGNASGDAGIVEAGSFTDAVAVSAGGSQSCAVASGKAYCWGRNINGQLGDDSYETQPTPVEVLGLTNVTAIATGSSHSCAISNGNPFCWGSNRSPDTATRARSTLGSSNVGASIPAGSWAMAASAALAPRRLRGSLSFSPPDPLFG